MGLEGQSSVPGSFSPRPWFEKALGEVPTVPSIMEILSEIGRPRRYLKRASGWLAGKEGVVLPQSKTSQYTKLSHRAKHRTWGLGSRL